MEGKEEVGSAFPPQLEPMMQAYQGSQGNPAIWFCSMGPRTTTWMVSPEHCPARADVTHAPSWLAPGPGAGPYRRRADLRLWLSLLPALCPAPRYCGEGEGGQPRPCSGYSGAWPRGPTEPWVTHSPAAGLPCVEGGTPSQDVPSARRSGPTCGHARSRRQPSSQLRTALTVTLLQSLQPGWRVCSPLAAQTSPGPRPASRAPHGGRPPEHSPPSLKGSASPGTQTAGDNSWETWRETLNHSGPVSSPANLSYCNTGGGVSG